MLLFFMPAQNSFAMISSQSAVFGHSDVAVPFNFTGVFVDAADGESAGKSPVPLSGIAC